MIMVSRSNIFFHLTQYHLLKHLCFLHCIARVRLTCCGKEALIYKDFKQGRNDFSYLFRIHVLGSVGDSVTLSLLGLRVLPFYFSTFRAVVLKMWSLDQQHQHYLGNCQKQEFLGLAPELLNPILWRCGPAICVLTSPPRVSDACSHLRTTDLRPCPHLCGSNKPMLQIAEKIRAQRRHTSCFHASGWKQHTSLMLFWQNLGHMAMHI